MEYKRYRCFIKQSSKEPGIESCIAGRNTLGIAGKNRSTTKEKYCLVFDMVRMSSEMNSSYEKLKQMQSRMVVLYGLKADLMIVISHNTLLPASGI